MKPKELSERFRKFIQSSQSIYENHMKIYGNDAPICHNFESALYYILEVSPETYEKLVSLSNGIIGDVVDIVVDETLHLTIKNLAELCPDEDQRQVLQLMADILKVSATLKRI